MRYLAIDPGLVTGAAYFDTKYPDEDPFTWEIPGGLAGFVEWHWDTVSEYHGPFYTDHVTIEDWRVRPNTHKLTPQPDPYLIIGYVQGYGYREEIPLSKVGPSEHKAFNGKGKNSKVRRLGWGEATMDGHDEDACSLLLHTLRREEKTIFADLMKGIIDE